ncbi:MAG TPA: M23 family metallopeptidase, partial [Thermaerobacter sp.]
AGPAGAGDAGGQGGGPRAPGRNPGMRPAPVPGGPGGRAAVVSGAVVSGAVADALRRWEATVRPHYPDLDPRLLRPGFWFPLPRGRYKFDRDTFGDPRRWTPAGPRPRRHQGNDILAARGTPVRAVGAGRVLARGWSPYGGWFILVELAGTGHAAYYSHLDRYAPGTGVGRPVQPGQVLGFVGNTGYGPPGTRGKFWPHLHFELRRLERGTGQGDRPGTPPAEAGVKDRGAARGPGRPVNPYPYLRYWEAWAAAEEGEGVAAAEGGRTAATGKGEAGAGKAGKGKTRGKTRDRQARGSSP